ncbi:MAG: Gfo/Idh/MocA family oxidoreductase [Christensenella sp.]|nr:Gfo/Idh/MocA family oxidoreductase [Christensenella sp.]
MMKQFRVCIVGSGFVGAAHIEALRRLGNVEILAVCNRHGSQEKADALFVPKGYDDYRQMLEIERPDVVHICTPNDSHYEIAMFAMERGMHVICEKPMTRTLDEARTLASYAKAHDLVTAVNFNCRFYPQILQARATAQSGALGDIRAILGGYLQDWLFWDTDYSWRLEPEVSGESRAFADIGSHWIDMVEFVTGLRATEVFADFETFHPTRKKPLKPVESFSGVSLRPEDYQEIPITTEDFCTALFRFDNGAIGNCSVSQTIAGRKNQIQLTLSGSKSSLFWDSDNSNELWLGYREQFNQIASKDPALLAPSARAAIGYPGGHVEGYPDTFRQAFRAMYAAIEAGGGTERTFADFSDGCRIAAIVDAVVKSAKSGGWVKIEA